MSVACGFDDMESLAKCISALTLVEVAQLSKLLEVYGITIQTLPYGEYGEFDVVLESFNGTKLKVIREVMSIACTSLLDSKKMIESRPVIVKGRISYKEAEKIKKQLENAGATVSLKQSEN